tara:strand:+ start:938 stop:1345 length:408 start_codon:yes stop_codon:yes gene_type:complete
MGTEIPAQPERTQDITDRRAEAKRIVKRLAAIVEDHRQAGVALKIELGPGDLQAVLERLRTHAKGLQGTPLSGGRDEIHSYCLNRLYDELVEEPSNILFTTKTGPDSVRYDAMNAAFWIECLDLMEDIYCAPQQS